jgi:hypothetical protein
LNCQSSCLSLVKGKGEYAGRIYRSQQPLLLGGKSTGNLHLLLTHGHDFINSSLSLFGTEFLLSWKHISSWTFLASSSQPVALTGRIRQVFFFLPRARAGTQGLVQGGQTPPLSHAQPELFLDTGLAQGCTRGTHPTNQVPL